MHFEFRSSAEVISEELHFEFRRNAEESSEAVSKPDVKYECGTNSEENVSGDKGCACCLASLNAEELLERAEKLSVEVSVVLNLREGRFLRLYLCCGKKVNW